MSASYHTHICRTSLPAMVAAAERSELDVLGISEHVYQLREGRSLFSQPPLEGRIYDLEEYQRQVRWTAAPGLHLRLGVELDYLPGREADSGRFLDGVPWDFILGSVHQVDGQDVHSERHLDLAAGWALWRQYTGQLEAAVDSGLFDILAHPIRLARRITPPPYLGDLLADLAVRAAARGVSLELNTADLTAAAGASDTLLEACKAGGARVTLGADAHRPEEVARNFELAAELLRRHGFAGLTGFRARTPLAEPLPRSRPTRRPAG